MARFYRRRYRRYRPRKYIRRYFRRRIRKFVNGSSRSQVRVKVPVSVVHDWARDGATMHTNVFRIGCFDNTSYATSPIRSELYRTYCSLYDEVQCIGMKVRFSVTNAVGAATLPAIKVHTCWDRRRGWNEPAYSFDEVVKSSSYMPATAINNSICKMQRSCYQSDLIEKCQWHDSSIATDSSSGTAVLYDAAWQHADVNPNFFCPALYAVLEEVGTENWVAPSLMVDIIYYYKFRNPKFGASSTNRGAQVVSLGMDDRRPDAGDDMDDDEQIVDLDANAIGSMSAMADMQASPVARAAVAAAPVEGRVAASRSYNQHLDHMDRINTRPVFGGRGSLNA